MTKARLPESSGRRAFLIRSAAGAGALLLGFRRESYGVEEYAAPSPPIPTPTSTSSSPNSRGSS